MDLRPTLVLGGLLIASALVHVSAWVALGWLPSIEEFLGRAPVSIEVDVVAPEPPPPPEPEPEAEPEPEPEPPPPEPEVVRPEPRPIPTPSAEPPPPDAPPPTDEPPAAEEAIAEFPEIMEGGEAWVSASGDGPVEGPIGQPGAQVTGRRREGTSDGVPGGTGEPEGPRLVAAADLSRQAGPPNTRLTELLRNNYPPRARDLGIEGTAVVRLRVSANGRVQPLAVVSEEYEGFGSACRQTLRQGPRWDPPLDRQGEAVDTILNFRCTFTIR